MKRLIALALLTIPAAAQPQAYQCTIPDQIEQPPPPRPDGPVRRSPIGRFTLAASWSPEFCRNDQRSMQCSGRNGRFGFVLHGLWPESNSGPPPQWCALTPRPSPQLIRAQLCMTPVPWLLEHEWAKHGSCMSRSPERYFNTAGILWRSLSWPDADALSRQDGLTAGALRDAFAARNPGWRPEMVGLVTSRSGWLRELHLCYNRDFQPARCPRRDFGPPDSAPLSIWRGL